MKPHGTRRPSSGCSQALASNSSTPVSFTTAIRPDSVLFAGLPGAATDPRYVHGQVSAAIDLRDSPGYSRRGSLLSTTFHNFHETSRWPVHIPAG